MAVAVAWMRGLGLLPDTVYVRYAELMEETSMFVGDELDYLRESDGGLTRIEGDELEREHWD
ncbi:MAG: hypothetical protein Kow0069_33980 [Promethearchaeota archaeon]